MQRAAAAVELGESAEIPWPEDVREAEFEMERMADAGGAAPPPARIILKRRTADEPFRFAEFAEPGVYRLRRSGMERGVAVNVPADECALKFRNVKEEARALAPADALAAATPEEQEAVLAMAHSGRPLWPELLAAAFLLLLAETILAGRPKMRGAP